MDTARDYAKASRPKTQQGLCKGLVAFRALVPAERREPMPPSPEIIGLYLTDWHLPRIASPAYQFRPSKSALRPGLELRAAGFHARPQEPPHRHRSGRDQAQTRAPAGAKGSHPCRGNPRHGRHPALRPAGSSRSAQSCSWVMPAVFDAQKLSDWM